MKRKNILLITSDQQHWFTMGYLNPEIKTPNLDRLAARGTVFSRGYTVNPTCTPTRASMITGTYPSQHGAWSLGTKLPETELTVGELLRGEGYRTALIGKAHFQQLLDHPDYRSIESNPHQQDLDWWRKFTGPFYGFERAELCRNHADEYHVGQHYAIWMEDKKGFKDWRDYYWKPAGRVDAGSQQYSWDLPQEYHYNTWIAERSCELLEQYKQDDERFFLWASFPDPHPPYLVPEPWASMYDPDTLTVPDVVEGEHDHNPDHFKLTQEVKPDFSAWQEPDGHAMHGFASHRRTRAQRARNLAVYYGMVSFMDKCIGDILDKLEETALVEDTLVVFTTDHGHFMGQHGLNAKGAFLYEDMIKLPYLVSLPGVVPAGVTSDALQSVVDLAPTFLAAAGLGVPRTMTGVNQWDVWQGKRERVRDHVLVENHHQPTTINQRCYVDTRYKITVYQAQDYGELFDLENDPEELHNLWDDPAAVELKQRLLLKLVQAELAKEPMWMPRVACA